MLRSVSVFLIMLVLLPTFAQADELTPQKAEDIKRLLRVSRIEDSFLDTVEMSVALARAQAEQQGAKLTSDEKRVIDTEMRSLFREKFTGSRGLFDMLVPVYAETFTHKEIREHIAFYATPLGKKTAAASGKLSTKISLVGLEIIAKAMEEMPARIAAALHREGLLKKEPKAGEEL